MSLRNLFHDLLPFVFVAETESFRGAAERLGQTPAAITRAIQRLEESLGVVLFHRTTRTVKLSAEGALFLERAREAVALVRAGRDAVEMARESSGGEVGVSISPALAWLVLDRLPDFYAGHPELTLRLEVVDTLSHLVEDEVDIAVRIGPLDDANWIARRLTQTRWATVASPSYLAGRGEPEEPSELTSHHGLVFRSPSGERVAWAFKDGLEVMPKCRLELDRGDLLVAASERGLGVTHALDCMVRESVAAGRLLRVLEAWSAEGPPVHALTKPGHKDTPRVRAVLDFLAGVFA